MTEIYVIHFKNGSSLNICHLDDGGVQITHSTTENMVILNKNYPLHIEEFGVNIVIWCADKICMFSQNYLIQITEQDFVSRIFYFEHFFIVGDNHIIVRRKTDLSEISRYFHHEIISNCNFLENKKIEFTDVTGCIFVYEIGEGSVSQINAS